MRRIVAAPLALLGLAFAAPAHARFLEGYLADCSAVAAGSCTEFTGGNYNRAAISFSDAVKGLAVSRVPFAIAVAGSLAGRAVYDSPTGGNLLVVIPLATPLTIGSTDAGDVGALSITVPALATYPNAGSYNATVNPAATLGTSGDGSTVTAGIGGNFVRGEFTARLAAVDPSYSVQIPLTGFTITPANIVSTLVLNPAGTLATGALTMPAAPSDGQILRLICSQTVNTLTPAANTGQSLVGSATSCGASASHAWLYAAGPTNTLKTWYQLY